MGPTMMGLDMDRTPNATSQHNAEAGYCGERVHGAGNRAGSFGSEQKDTRPTGSTPGLDGTSRRLICPTYGARTEQDHAYEQE